MKLPLWCKGRTGEYHRFPYEILQTLPNGKLGISYHHPSSWDKANGILAKLYADTGWHPGHFFEYDYNMDAYVLKGEPGK